MTAEAVRLTHQTESLSGYFRARTTRTRPH
uniref:Uncharacterized protein n=1 Tax=Salmonella phage vB_SEnST11_KE23 TaxID=3161174 RepID=A0AAU8GHE7_9CAUD